VAERAALVAAERALAEPVPVARALEERVPAARARGQEAPVLAGEAKLMAARRARAVNLRPPSKALERPGEKVQRDPAALWPGIT
jgi:hypothetical protein